MKLQISDMIFDLKNEIISDEHLNSIRKNRLVFNVKFDGTSKLDKSLYRNIVYFMDGREIIVYTKKHN